MEQQQNAEIDSGIPRNSITPSAIINNNLLSPTSLASECFINQRFSSKLQIFLVGYVNSIYSQHSVYK